MSDPWANLLCTCRIVDGLIHELCGEHEAETAPPWELQHALDLELDAVVNGHPVRYDRNRVTGGSVPNFRVQR